MNDLMRDKLTRTDGSLPLWAEMISGGTVSVNVSLTWVVLSFRYDRKVQGSQTLWENFGALFPGNCIDVVV